ncbi:serine hydrolase domain-containing protein [Paraburkholderia susongensis]|uniref:CubicO group peptidase, beta-lactamase class C family n=1 Tax=Paraburkholderia susongensis TaxID=1515439 RepID=A0A1X7LMX3_9BURK|nr:serine hydrolase domain-containing protein [Paraburkholderia susongensis]SMG54877.1 CubicO group peptidase, beta-lactamase class C family [Paraburkholderia susongensis]
MPEPMIDLNRFLVETTASGKIPGVSFAALRVGTRIAEHYCGVRGVHDRSSVDAATVFEAASLTKPLVAHIALQLSEEGLLDLQKPLFDICGEFIPGDSISRRITAFHVLTHTSGLPNIVRDKTPLRTYFNPGERFSYGSTAFAWLQRAMEAVSASPLEMLARERIFDPLAMRHSSLEWQERFAVNHAQGHEWDGQPVPKRRVQTAQASWSLLTTASDYISFVQHILARGGLTAASYDQWFVPRVNTRQGDDAEDLIGQSSPDLNVAWGLGWGLEPSQGCFFHWGNNPGFRALVFANRATQDAVVWFANSDRGMRLVHKVLPEAVPGEHPAVGWLRIGSL